MSTPVLVRSAGAEPFRLEWLKVAVLMLVAVFFGYRYLTLLAPFYAALCLTLLALAVLSWRRMLPERLEGLAFSSAVSLVFLDLVFYQIDLGAMLGAVSRLNYGFLVPTSALIVLSFLIRSARWGWLLRNTRAVPFISLLSGFSIGIAANMILPARAGEFIRAYVLGRREGLSKTTVFATVVLERIFDGLTVLLALLGVVLFMGVRGPEIQAMGFAGAAFYIGAIAAIVLVYFKEPWLERRLRLLPAAIADKAIALLRAFADGLASIRSWRQLAMITLLSLVTWIVIALSFWPALAAFDFGAPVPPYTPFLLIATAGLALMIPAAPAGIGPFQYACLLTLRIAFAPALLSLAGDFNEKAAAFSLVAHLSQAAPEILMGLIFFLFEGLSLRDVRTDL